MFSKAITAALKRHASDRMRYCEQKIAFYQQKKADPHLEELAYRLCKGHFYLLKVEEIRAIVINDLKREVEILKKRLKEGFILDNFICEQCRKRVISVTRLLMEPECVFCEVCYSTNN